MSKEFFIGGRKGESVFTESFIEWTAGQQLPAFLDRLDKAGDEKSFVLVSALSVEAYTDSLFAAIAPGYTQLLSDRSDLTFSLKLHLLKALRLIPPHIISAADIVRQVRNVFAHDLNTELLGQATEKIRSKLRTMTIETFGNDNGLKTDHDNFRMVTFIACAGLESYRSNFLKLRAKLDDESVIESWKRMPWGLRDETRNYLFAATSQLQGK